jgi:hypothetical protein
MLGIVRCDPAGELFRHGAEKLGNGAVVVGHCLSDPVAADKLALTFGEIQHVLPGIGQMADGSAVEVEKSRGVGRLVFECGA